MPLVAALALLAAGCGGGDDGAKTVPSNAVAVVGDETITKAEFDRLIEQARRTAKQQKRPFPKAGTPEFAGLRQNAVEYLVRQSEFRQKAEDMDVEVSDKDVDKRLTELKKQFYGGDQKKYEKQIKALGLSDEQVRKDVRSQLVEDRLFKKVTEDVEVSDKQIQDYYKKNKQQYTQPASRDVRHILVKKRGLAFRLHRQLKNGGNFAALAKKHSQDPGSKTQGGKLTVSKGQTVPPFDKVAFSIKKGQLAEPVKTQFGWHIIEALSDVRAERATPLKEVKAAIKQQLLQQEKTDRMRTWVEDLKDEFEVSYQAGYEPPKPQTTGTGTTTEE